MKKIITCTFVFFILVFINGCVSNAAEVDLEGSDMMKPEVTIIWHDYNDGLSLRPSSITLPFTDSTDATNNQSKTINASDCVIEDVGDGIRTTWKTTVNLPITNSRRMEPNYTLGVEVNDMFATDYKCVGSSGYAKYLLFGMADIESFVFEIWPARSYSPTYNFKVVYYDGNDRDRNRSSIAHYKIVGSNGTETPITLDSDDIYMQSLPAYAEVGGLPDLNQPITYSIESVNKDMEFDGKKYNFEIQRNGLYITLYASFEPKNIADIPVSIDFGNNSYKKPDSVNVKLKTSKDNYGNMDLTKGNSYNSKFENVYLHDVDGSIAQYEIEIDDTSDWEFTVNGNQVDGFLIKAKYIGKIDTQDDKPKEEIKPSNVRAGGFFHDIKEIKYFVIGYLIICFMAINVVRKRK